jgi:hypothetical protein
MKVSLRTIILALLIVVLLPILPVGAQDGGDEQAILAPTISAVYYLSATSGSFADQGDGTYLLTLDGVGEDIGWIVTQPSLALGTVSNVNLNAQWAAADGLVADAVLQVGGLNVMVTLSSPTYDSATQTYIVAVGDIVSFEGVKEPDLPTTFDAANLSIAWSLEFEDGLITGIQAMYTGMRATPEQCQASQNTYNSLRTQYYQINSDLSTAFKACQGGDAAACDKAKTLQAQLYSVQQSLTTTSTFLRSQCS